VTGAGADLQRPDRFSALAFATGSLTCMHLTAKVIAASLRIGQSRGTGSGAQALRPTVRTSALSSANGPRPRAGRPSLR